METLSRFVDEGHQPNRTFYVAFGHDEEVSGNQGAAFIADLLKEKLDFYGEELSFILGMNFGKIHFYVIYQLKLSSFKHLLEKA